MRPGTAPAAAEPRRRRGVAPRGLAIDPSIKHMWSLPGFRSAADAARGHRAMRTRRGPIGATAADRDLGRDHIHNIHILFDIMTRPFGATAVRRCGSAAAGAVPGRHLRAPSGPEASGGAVWRRARASDAVWRHFVVTGRFLAVLMPTGGSQQGIILG